MIGALLRLILSREVDPGYWAYSGSNVLSCGRTRDRRADYFTTFPLDISHRLIDFKGLPIEQVRQQVAAFLLEQTQSALYLAVNPPEESEFRLPPLV